MCLALMYGPMFVPVLPKPLADLEGVWLKEGVSERRRALRDLEDRVPSLPGTQLPGGFDAIVRKRVIKRLQETLQENLEN